MTDERVTRLLIFRNGAIGDTIVALPALHWIAEQFPGAEKTVLTVKGPTDKKPVVEQILEDTPLVDNFMYWGLHDNLLSINSELRDSIRAYRPDVLVYLLETRNLRRLVRDWLFFKWCGIPRTIGFPPLGNLRATMPLEAGGVYRHEAENLLDRVSGKAGQAGVTPANRDMWEIETGPPVELPYSKSEFFVCSFGSKVELKEWGTAKWEALFERIAPLTDKPVVFVGDDGQKLQADRYGQNWPHGFLNLCGELSIKASFSVIRRAAFFLGIDSGPMHMAAAADVPCVAVFTARALPGIWFPYGKRNKVAYHQTHCAGCGLDVCIDQNRHCIESITVDEVVDLVTELFHEEGL